MCCSDVVSLLDTSKIIKFCLSVCLKSPKRLSFCFCSFINNSLHIKLLNLADYSFTGIDGCKAPSYLSDDHDHSLTPGSNGFLKRKDNLCLLNVTKRLFQDLVHTYGALWPIFFNSPAVTTARAKPGFMPLMRRFLMSTGLSAMLTWLRSNLHTSLRIQGS